MKNLAEVTKQLHLCIEAEFIKEMNGLKKREKEIQDLIDKLIDLTEFRTDQENTVLCDLFSNDSQRKTKCLNKYEELSKVLKLSNLKISCQRVLSQNHHLDYSINFKDDEVYQFSSTSNALVIYDLSGMEKRERPLEGEFMETSVLCVLPDDRLLCCRRGNSFLFDVNRNSSTNLEVLVYNIQNAVSLLENGTIHLFGKYDTSDHRGNKIARNAYLQFDLNTLRWSFKKGLNLGELSEDGISFAKFEGRIYATARGSEYVYTYCRKKGKFIQIFKLGYGSEYSKLLFEHRNVLFLLLSSASYSRTTLYSMKPNSKKFFQLKNYNSNLRIVMSGIMKKLRNSLYFCCDQFAVRFDPETYEFTTIQLNQART